ncbi:MAG: hypothetical protein M3Q30_02780 [Actinomycetota bacterium]|nr:hypothetical protein [Actinomycetota bacterium]
MSIHVEASTLSRAWVNALQETIARGGKAVNMIVSWPGTEEDPQARKILDAFIESRPSGKNDWPRWSVETVANTIFPLELYEPDGTDADALEEFSYLYMEGREIAKLVSPTGEYCERLVSWEGPDGKTINQLLEVGQKLRSYGRNHLSSVYEIAVADPSFDLRTQRPGKNNDPYGFPCLSHISLTVVDGVLHATALYRNQHLVRKAYGNYVGVSRLAWALANYAELDLGEVAVVATHADAEIGSAKGLGKRAIEDLVAEVKAVLE